MNRRRYTIEANVATLARFTTVLAAEGVNESFIDRVTSSTNDEYYYVIVFAPNNIHEVMHRSGFTNSSRSVR